VLVEVWSDVVCPWCYIGKRRFDRARAELDGEIEFEVEMRAFQLDPRAPPGTSMPVADVYARKFGGPEQADRIIANVTAIAADEGLEFRLDRAQRANTMLAHRAIQLAVVHGGHSLQAAVDERLMVAYFTDGLDIGDPDTVARCAADAGMDHDAVRAALDRDDGTNEVDRSIARAAELGVTAVPTYVIDGSWAIPGAQESETFVQVLRRFAARLDPAR